MTQVILRLALLELGLIRNSWSSKVQLGEYVLKWPVLSCSPVTYLTRPVVAYGLICHHRTFGSYHMVCQFAFKLNSAVNAVQETLLDSVPYAKDANGFVHLENP